MVRANKIRIDKYKLEYITKLVGVYIRQKWIFTDTNISTKMGNINGETSRMNYIHVNHLVQIYDDFTSLYFKSPVAPGILVPPWKQWINGWFNTVFGANKTLGRLHVDSNTIAAHFDAAHRATIIYCFQFNPSNNDVVTNSPESPLPSHHPTPNHHLTYPPRSRSDDDGVLRKS